MNDHTISQMYLLSIILIIFGCLSTVTYTQTVFSKFPTNPYLPSCPCSDQSLCKPLDIGPRKEVVGFVTAKDNWKRYNYTHLTTLAIFGELDPQLVCFAHQHNVRVVLAETFNLTQLMDFDYRHQWISSTIDMVKNSFLDGINIDIEDPIEGGSNTELVFMVFLDEISTAFHQQIPGSSVSADVAWAPHCIDERCYDHLSMASYMDFLVVMAYDERSQIFGPCVASANSAVPQTADGIREFVKLGIHPWKLVLGQPWYGYNYPCESLQSNGTCTIRQVPFRNVNCSDAAGSQVSYYDILQLLNSTGAERMWDDTLKAPYFTYQNSSDSTHHQVWYDDPQSLQYKCSFSHLMGLRGMAFWNLDQLDYTSADWEQVNEPMWSTLDQYFDDEYWYL